MVYMLGDLIGASVGRLLDNNCKYPTIEEVFPVLFKKEIINKDDDNQVDINNELLKIQMMSYMNNKNKCENDRN